MAIPHGQLQRGVQAETMPAGSSGQLTAAASAWLVHAEQPPQLVLVGSAAQAQQVQHSLDEAEVIRHSLGLAPLTAQVIQLDAGSADATQQAVADLNVVRHALGLVDAQLVNLLSTPPTTDPASSVATTISTAAQARQAIADDNRLRVSLGLPELDPPPADQAARQAIADENQLRAASVCPSCRTCSNPHGPARVAGDGSVAWAAGGSAADLDAATVCAAVPAWLPGGAQPVMDSYLIRRRRTLGAPGRRGREPRERAG
jgi:hypothetical protein